MADNLAYQEELRDEMLNGKVVLRFARSLSVVLLLVLPFRPISLRLAPPCKQSRCPIYSAAAPASITAIAAVFASSTAFSRNVLPSYLSDAE